MCTQSEYVLDWAAQNRCSIHQNLSNFSKLHEEARETKDWLDNGNKFDGIRVRNRSKLFPTKPLHAIHGEGQVIR